MRLNEVFLKKVIPQSEVFSGTLTDDITFSLDSRTIQKDELFIPIKGDRVDGHNFLEEVLKKAKGSFVAFSKKELLETFKNSLDKNKIIILVENPAQAFIELATAWRAQFSYPIVAITGSIGKTSTKSLLTRIVQEGDINVFSAHGNQNTLLGIALNMAHLTDDHEMGIFEVGINKRGEMEEIVAHLQPTTALITCIAHCHMEGLGTFNDIAAEKRKIFSCFTETSIGIINGDQQLLSGVAYAHPVIKFGLKTTNQIQARKIKQVQTHVECILKIYGKKYEVTIPGNHQGVMTNILASVAMAYHLGVSAETIVQAVQVPILPARRYESCILKPEYKGYMIDDAYNASPESVKAALLALQSLKTKSKKIVVLGDMLELGQSSSFWHRQIGRFLRKTPSVEKLILVGKEVKWTHKTAPVGIEVTRVDSWEDASIQLKGALKDESVILVKGSLGMNLSKLVQEFTE